MSSSDDHRGPSGRIPLRPLILSGGPAVGKSTCGRLLAGERRRAAFIDADDIRQLVVAGDRTLWSGPEGEEQHRLAARNVAALAANFADDGFEVVVADFVTADSSAVYRRALPDCLLIHLRLSLDGAWRRAGTRPVHLTDDEFVLLHRMIRVPPPVDRVLDVEDLTLEDQLALIRTCWQAGCHDRRSIGDGDPDN